MKINLEESKEDEKEPLEDQKDNELKDENPGVGKKVYRRVHTKKKLELATYCRDFFLEHGRPPKFKEVRFDFP